MSEREENSSDGVRFDKTVACENCGQFGAFVFDGKSVCAECYELQGSCCADRDP